MVSVSALLSKKFWEGFGYFLIIFGVWDIFFYLWLKVIINWPDSFLTYDILFLIPIPWIAPVLAPVLISLLMILIGIDMTRMMGLRIDVKPGIIHWALVLVGSSFILYSFMHDFGASFYEKIPEPFYWIWFTVGMVLYIISYLLLRYRTKSSGTVLPDRKNT